MTTKSKSPIIIIGMHRSGTSMLSRLLETAGVFMGQKKDINNEAFFFLNFNDWIFSQANATWDNPYNLKFVDEEFKDVMEYCARLYLKSLIVKDYLGIRKFFKYRTIFNIDFPWGWKDPRNTYTLDVWLRIFPNAKILHIYRHPVDVAESLRKRSQKKKIFNIFNLTRKKKVKLFLKGYVPYKYSISIRVLNLTEGIDLYKEYVKKAFSYDSLNILHIKYEHLLTDAYHVMKNILSFIDISITDSALTTLIKDINASRCFAFKKNKSLVKFNRNLMDTDLDYSNLLKELGYYENFR